MSTSRLELARAALATALATAFAGTATVERNRDVPADFRTYPKQIVVHDGGHTRHTIPGVAEYTVLPIVEGYAAINDAGNVGTACDAIYLAVIGAVTADPTLGGLSWAVREVDEELTTIEVLRETERGLAAKITIPLMIRLNTAETDPTMAA